MRILATLLLVACASTAPAPHPSDGLALQRELAQTRDAFLAATRDLTPEQARFKPAADRWSILEIAEHIALAENALYTRVTEKIVATPATPELLARVQQGDARISVGGADRSKKREAPETIRPTGRFATLADARDAFTTTRQKTLTYADTTKADLHAYAAEHQALGVMDARQWILFMAAHSARHTAQIIEVKASPDYPR